MTMATPFHLGSCTGMAMAQAQGQAETFRADRLAGPAPASPTGRRFFPVGVAHPQLLSASASTRMQALSRPPLSKTKAVAVESNQLDSPLEAPEKETDGAGKYCFVVANAKFMLDEEEHFKELLFERLRNFGERNREQDFWLVIEPKFLDKFPSLTNRLKRPAVALVSTDATWITNFGERNREQDFWLVIEPKFLDKFPSLTNRLKRPAVALVSTDATWITNFGERNREQDFWLVIEPKFLDKFPSLTNRLKRPAVALVSTDATWITFMKLRLDRVLYAEYEANSLEEALASYPTDLKFPDPENWVAPYPKYEYGWWERFLPPTNSKHHVQMT